MPIKLKSNELLYIDNGFYRITAQQAKKLCGGAILPAPGYSRGISRDRIDGFQFGERHAYALPGKPDHCKFIAFRPQPMFASASVSRTCLSWHNGAPVKHGWTWAVQLHTRML